MEKKNSLFKKAITIKIFAPLLCAIIIQGCAHTNEGSVDYRKAEPATTVAPKKDDASNCTSFKYKNFTPANAETFHPKDTLSVHLRTAYIADFAELFDFKTLLSRKTGKPTGEIAIVANAMELHKGEDGKASPLKFTDLEAGRLIFYSDDVLKGQFLNFNNVPIYGPTTYSGGPIALRFTIFELDVTSAQTKAMLDAISKSGTSIYPPASPVLSVLNKFGKALAGGKQNDTEFRYLLVLDEKNGSNKLHHPMLEVGNYVFIRTEKRGESIHWDNLIFDENEGRLYCKQNTVSSNCKDSNGRKIYVGDTYLVVEINKSVSSVKVDLQQNTFSELMDVLKKADAESADRLNVATTSLNNVALQRLQIKNFNKAKDLLHTFKTSPMEAQKLDALHQFNVIIGGAVNDDGTILDSDPATGQPSLDQEQLTYLISKLRALAKDTQVMEINRKTIKAASQPEQVSNFRNYLK